MTERERMAGTWRIHGVYHAMYLSTQSSANDKQRYWYNTACGFATPTFEYDFNAQGFTSNGKPFKEPRVYKKDITCLTCLVQEVADGQMV